MKSNYTLIILLSFPCYIILNIVLYNCAGFLTHEQTHFHLTGSYVSLSSSRSFPYSYLLFIAFRWILCCCLFIKFKYKPLLGDVFSFLFLFDFFSILFYIIKMYFHWHWFDVFSSYALLYAFSRKYMFTPGLLPLIVIAVEFFILKKSAALLKWKQMGVYALLALASVALWWALKSLHAFFFLNYM